MLAQSRDGCQALGEAVEGRPLSLFPWMYLAGTHLVVVLCQVGCASEYVAHFEAQGLLRLLTPISSHLIAFLIGEDPHFSELLIAISSLFIMLMNRG